MELKEVFLQLIGLGQDGIDVLRLWVILQFVKDLVFAGLLSGSIAYLTTRFMRMVENDERRG